MKIHTTTLLLLTPILSLNSDNQQEYKIQNKDASKSEQNDQQSKHSSKSELFDKEKDKKQRQSTTFFTQAELIDLQNRLDSLKMLPEEDEE